MVELEETLRLWEWGKWARSAWLRPMKMPGWVKEIKTLDREKTLGRIIGDIPDEYGEFLDRKISVLNKENLINADVIVNIYVNLRSVDETARDMKVSKHTVRKEREGAIRTLYGNMAKIG